MCWSTTVRSPGCCARAAGKGTGSNGSPLAWASTCAMPCPRRSRVAPCRSTNASRTCGASTCSTDWCRRWSASPRLSRRCRSGNVRRSRGVTGCAAASSASRPQAVPAGSAPTARCWSIWGRGRSACARAMSSSPDLSRRARLALAASLVITAASLPRLSAVQRFAGGTAVPLAAGACALVVLLAARLPLGFSWGPARSRRLVADVASGFALGAVCAAGLIWDGNEARLAQLWRDDRAAAVALLAGVAAWGAAVAATRQRALGRWYAAAAGAALLPEALLIAVLRPAAPSGFAAAFGFFLVADTAVAFATEELAFRRALVGPPDGAGLGALIFMAVVFGLWHAVQPGYGGAPWGTFLGTALGGAPIATGRAGLAAGLALGSTAALAVALGWLVRRRGGREASRLS